MNHKHTSVATPAVLRFGEELPNAYSSHEPRPQPPLQADVIGHTRKAVVTFSVIDFGQRGIGPNCQWAHLEQCGTLLEVHHSLRQ